MGAVRVAVSESINTGMAAMAVKTAVVVVVIDPSILLPLMLAIDQNNQVVMVDHLVTRLGVGIYDADGCP